MYGRARYWNGFPRYGGNAELVEKLLARGADLSLRDAVYDGTPAGWAEAGGNEDLAKRLAARSG